MGRPKLNPKQRRRRISALIAPATHEALAREVKRTGESRGKLLDRLAARLRV